MIRSCLLAGAVCPCLLSATVATADTRERDDIVVTATRSATARADTAASVSILSATDIRGTPAAAIDDVLRRVPSVDLPIASTNEQHPTNTIVSMRGLGGIRTLVLLDGVPINDPFFGYVQWSEVPIDTIERVEVVRGGGATLWGNYAMGGVINILTRPIDRTEGIASAAAGSRGTYRADAHAAIAGGAAWGVAVDAGAAHSDGYVEQVEAARGAITVPTGFTARTIAVSANAAPTATIAIQARASGYANDQNFLTRLNTNRQRTQRYTGTLTWTPDARTTIALTGYHVGERFATDNPGTPTGAGAADAEYVQNRHTTHASDWGASAIATWTFAGTLRSLSVGADHHAVRGRDVAAIFAEDGARVRTDRGSGGQRFAGGFVQADLRPTDRLQLLASVRYQDFLSHDGRDDTPGGLGDRVPRRHDRDVDPRVSLRYALPAGVALRGAFYRAFRAPTLDNLYRGASVPGYILFANPALKPETLEGGEAGFDVDRGAVHVQATAYAARITDFLTYRYLAPDTLPVGFDVGARLINAGTARTRGIEAEVAWRPSHALTATLAYTYADSIVTRNPADPASVGVQQPGIPRHRASAGIDWTGPLDVTITPRLRYVGPTNGDPDALYRTDAHVIADVGARLPVRSDLSLFVEIENLFNRRYIGTNDGFTAPLYGKPFTAVAGLRALIG